MLRASRAGRDGIGLVIGLRPYGLPLFTRMKRNRRTESLAVRSA
jgi:hypothetical protein